MNFRRIVCSLIVILILIIILNFYNIAKFFYPIKYPDYISKYSKEYNLDPYFVTAVIKTESNFDENAQSSKNAYGLMQITAGTGEWAAKEMKLEKYNNDLLIDPEYNIRMGCWYLSDLKKQFNNNDTLVLAAYNGGRGNVQKWLNSCEHSQDGKNLSYIPFKETDQYVKKVNVNYKIYKYLYTNNQQK